MCPTRNSDPWQQRTHCVENFRAREKICKKLEKSACVHPNLKPPWGTLGLLVPKAKPCWFPFPPSSTIGSPSSSSASISPTFLLLSYKTHCNCRGYAGSQSQSSPSHSPTICAYIYINSAIQAHFLASLAHAPSGLDDVSNADLQLFFFILNKYGLVFLDYFDILVLKIIF